MIYYQSLEKYVLSLKPHPVFLEIQKDAKLLLRAYLTTEKHSWEVSPKGYAILAHI